MAVIQTGQTCKMVLKVAVGTTTQGKTKYGNRTISNVSPDASNQAVYTFGSSLASLQLHDLGEIQRYDISVLMEE